MDQGHRQTRGMEGKVEWGRERDGRIEKTEQGESRSEGTGEQEGANPAAFIPARSGIQFLRPVALPALVSDIASHVDGENIGIIPQIEDRAWREGEKQEGQVPHLNAP